MQTRSLRPVVMVLLCLALAGCGAVAFPFRVTADALRVVPVVGDPVAAPFDAVGNAID